MTYRKLLHILLSLGFGAVVFAAKLEPDLHIERNPKSWQFSPVQKIDSQNIQAGFLKDLIKAFTGAFESVFGRSGSSSGSGSGRDQRDEPYVPPNPPPSPPVIAPVGLPASVSGLTLPNASTPNLSPENCVVVSRNVAGNPNPQKLVDQGTAVPGVPVAGAPLAESVPLDNLQAIQKHGEPAFSTSSSFQVFIPTNDDTELSCFRGMPQAVRDELSLTISSCPPPPPPTTGGVWVNVAASGEPHATACARIGSVPERVLDSCGFCAAVESRPPLVCGNSPSIVWPGMPSRYQNNYSGGGHTAPGDRYCYKPSQKHDDDSTDRVIAWRCKDMSPPPNPTGGTAELVLTNCADVTIAPPETPFQ